MNHSVEVEARNISRAIHKTAPRVNLTSGNFNVRNLIERLSRVSSITGCHTQKLQIHVNSTVCHEAKDSTIDIKLRSLMEQDAMNIQMTFASMDSVR